MNKSVLLLRSLPFLILCLICISTLSFTPTAFAEEEFSDAYPQKDHTPTYRITDHINMVSTTKYFYGKYDAVIKAVYPQLEGWEEDEHVALFNQTVKALIMREVDEFRNFLKQNPPGLPGKNELYVDYSASVIPSYHQHLLSIRFSIQGFMRGMAHPRHYHQVLNYWLEKDKALTLEDIFLPQANYLVIFSDYTRETLARRLQDRALLQAGTQPTTENFQLWNLKNNGILLTFEEAQVAPYVNGAQTLLVPYSLLKNMIAPHSPIMHCVKNPKTCGNRNLLTGGFIDEAINVQYRRLNPLLSKL